MNRENRQRRGFLRLFAMALLAAGCAAGFAAGRAKEVFAASQTTYVSDVQELKEWYEKREPASAKLKKNLVINNAVSLKTPSSAWKKELDVDDYGIYIMEGGSLTIENQDFLLTGEERMIVVNSKGTFRFLEGTVRGEDEDKTVIAYKADSQVTILWSKVNITGRAVSSGTGATDPSGGNPTPQVLSVEDGALSMACMEGTSLTSLNFPAKVKTACLTADGKTQTLELPVVWDVSGVSTRQPGVYKMKGTFSDTALSAQGLTNPGKVTAELLLSVLRKEDAGTLNVRMISEDASGNTVVRLEFPMLTSDVTALYLYYSADGTHFTRESWAQMGVNGAITQTENFLGKASGKVDPPWQYLEYKRRADGPFWLRLEVVGSALAGKSNTVACDSLEEREPGRMHGGSSGTSSGSTTANKNSQTAVGNSGNAGGAGDANAAGSLTGAGDSNAGNHPRSGSSSGGLTDGFAGGESPAGQGTGTDKDVAAGQDGLIPQGLSGEGVLSGSGGNDSAKDAAGEDYAEGAEGLPDGFAGAMEGGDAGEWEGEDAYMDGPETSRTTPAGKMAAAIAVAVLLILAGAVIVIKKRI